MQLVANGAGGGEGVQALIEPAKQGFLAGFRQIGHMDVNISALTDPVQTTDALFQQIRMERQVKADQVLRKLKIAAFTTNFGTDQRLSTAVFLGKVGSSAVAFDKAQVLVEGRATNTGFQVQKVLQRNRCFFMRADHKHLFGPEIFQLCFQPLDPRVLFNPYGFWVQRFRMECLGVMLIKFWRRQRISVSVSLRKSGHPSP